MNKIIIVGGGSAGFMTAYTLKKVFPKKNIIVIKSNNISTVGVGESTLGHINQWLAMVGLKDEDFMKECNASYKLSIRFENFYKKEDGGFHYPFGLPNLENTIAGLNDWHFKKILYPETPRNNFAEIYFPNMSLVNHNTILDYKMPKTTYLVKGKKLIELTPELDETITKESVEANAKIKELLTSHTDNKEFIDLHGTHNRYHPNKDPKVIIDKKGRKYLSYKELCYFERLDTHFKDIDYEISLLRWGTCKYLIR